MIKGPQAQRTGTSGTAARTSSNEILIELVSCRIRLWEVKTSNTISKKRQRISVYDMPREVTDLFSVRTDLIHALLGPCVVETVFDDEIELDGELIEICASPTRGVE